MLSKKIHVAYPKLIGLKDVEFGELKESFKIAANGATAIDILGGYYSPAKMLSLFKSVQRGDRATCRVRIAIGLDVAVKMPDYWNGMRSLQNALSKEGFKNTEIYIVSGYPHFHTKLFHFLRRTHHLWFVGSANPGSERHELMVSLSGKHEALIGYLDAVFASRAAQLVTTRRPPKELPRTMREFFLTGSLIHKRPQQAPFTFDAFRLAPEDREKMMRALTSSTVPHARPTTQGFSFSLRSAVGSVEFAEERTDEISRIQLRRYTVDTVLGSWAPRQYGRDLEVQLGASEILRADDLRRFSASLTGSGEEVVRQAFAEYLASMEAFLLGLNIPVKSVEDREGSFKRFLTSRQAMLAQEDDIERLAQRLQIVEMPDVWYDEKAASAFETSFFEDIRYRLSVNASSKILRCFIRGIGEKLDYVSRETLVSLLESRLRDRPWGDEEWDEDG